MSNKAIGNNLEKDVARLLYDNGFWVKMLVGKNMEQAFDIIAIRKNVGYAFEVKNCENGKFNASRIEVNQKYGFKTFIRDCGSSNAYFVFGYAGEIYIAEADYVLSLPVGVIQVNKFETLGEWLSDNI